MARATVVLPEPEPPTTAMINGGCEEDGIPEDTRNRVAWNPMRDYHS
jgi:hypothetical protein